MRLFGKKSDDDDTSSQPSSTTLVSEKELIKCYTPFERPVHPIKPPVFDLTQEQEAQYEAVLSYFRSYVEKDIPINDSANAPTHPITDSEKAWLTKECFLRYLRAAKWKTNHAIKRLEDTLIWRRTFGVVKLGEDQDQKIIHADMVEHESLTGKTLILGYDNDNRPCLYLRNGYQNTDPSLKQIQFFVFMLERVIQFMPPGQDTLALLIDFKAAPAHLNLSSKFPSLSVSKQVLHILQSHYPERLGKGLFTNIPWLGHYFFKVVGPFIDPYTRLKTIYDQPFENFVPKEQLDKEFNGMLDFEYKHDIYWKELNALAEKKHAIYMKNFHQLGRGIGLSEYDLRQGTV